MIKKCFVLLRNQPVVEKPLIDPHVLYNFRYFKYRLVLYYDQHLRF